VTGAVFKKNQGDVRAKNLSEARSPDERPTRSFTRSCRYISAVADPNACAATYTQEATDGITKLQSWYSSTAPNASWTAFSELTGKTVQAGYQLGENALRAMWKYSAWIALYGMGKRTNGQQHMERLVKL
jgi:hypothetical protein